MFKQCGACIIIINTLAFQDLGVNLLRHMKGLFPIIPHHIVICSLVAKCVAIAGITPTPKFEASFYYIFFYCC